MHRTTARATRPLAFALALMLAISALLASPPGARAQEPPAPPAPITEGSLVWGVKASWGRYVGLEQTHVSGGASIGEDRVLTFPVTGGSYDDATRATTVQFGGSVRYASYCGFQGNPLDVCILDLTLSEPRITIDGDRQVLEAHVLSRPRAVELEPIVDYGVIPLVTLDITTSATVEVADGTTSWAGVLTALTAQGATAFDYKEGTAFEPVAFSYAGPGGAPDLGEVFAEPGTPALDEAGRWVAPDESGSPTALYADEGRGVVHLVTGIRAPGTPLVRAIDATTLAPIDTAVLTPADGAGVVAFDEAGGRLFLVSAGVVDGVSSVVVETVTYDPGTRTYVTAPAFAIPVTIGAAALTARAYTWDAANQRLVVLAFVREGAVRTARLVTGQEGEGTWSTQALPLAPAAGYADQPWFTPAPRGFAAAADGSIVLIRSTLRSLAGVTLLRPPALRLTTVDGAAVSEEIPGTGTQETAPDHLPAADRYVAVTTSPEGAVWFASDATAGQRVQEARVTDGSAITMEGEPLALPGLYGGMAADPVDGTLWLKSTTAQALAAVRDGRVVYQRTFTDFGQYDHLAVTSAHDVYSTFRSEAATPPAPGVARFTYVGTSPTITAQPEAVATTLGVGQESEAVAFTAEATGDPDPTVRWQRRGPGMSTFADVPGGTSTTLEVAATAGDDGADYRAVFSNAAGDVATEPATLSVEHAPVVAFQPSDVAVVAGGSAMFPVQGVGNPEPEITWQRLVGGFWTDVDPTSGDVVVNGGFLDIPVTTIGMDGATFRAKVTNQVATVFSRVATLSVVPVPDAGTVTGGHLDWGVKQSFRDYVTGHIAEGDITLADGATEQPDGTYRFPATSGTLDLSGTTTAAFEGSVHFRGHHGVGGDPNVSALDLRISNLRIQDPPGPDGGVLVADVVSRDFEGFESSGDLVTYLDVPLADLDLAGTSPTVDGDAYTWPDVPAQMTEPGAPAFAGFYDAGTELDPLTWVLEVDTEPVAPAITADPADLTVLAGTDAAFEATATGTPAPALRWQRLVDGLWWVDVDGAVGPTLSLPDVPVQATGTKVRAVATSSAGTATSAAATLTVLALPDFPDVGGEGPFTLPIAWLVDQGITTGYPDGTFRPTEVVTRQVAAAFLHRLAGSPAPPPGAPTFSDVPADHPFHQAIAWLVDQGITTGYPDGTFRPTEVVTRQSVAAFLHRLAGSPQAGEGAPAFDDVPGDHPFAAAIAWLAEQGTATGYPDGTFRPGEPITRQTAAALLYRHGHRPPVG